MKVEIKDSGVSLYPTFKVDEPPHSSYVGVEESGTLPFEVSQMVLSPPDSSIGIAKRRLEAAG